MIRNHLIPFFIRRRVYIAVGTPMLLLFWLAVMALPATETDMRRTVCLVDGSTHLCLTNGKDTVSVRCQNLHRQGVWVNKHWWWPSCDGRVLTSLRTEWQDAGNADTLAHRLADSLEANIKRAHTIHMELEYYLRCHGVQDEGYNRIAAYAENQQHALDSLSALKSKVQRITGSGKLHMICTGYYRVAWFDNKGKKQWRKCKPVSLPVSSMPATTILHTTSNMLPWGCRAVKNVPWGVAKHKSVITVTLCPDDSRRTDHTIMARGRYDKGKKVDVAHAFSLAGTAVFTMHGRFIGLINDEGCI